jgi:hypothetical protein
MPNMSRRNTSLAVNPLPLLLDRKPIDPSLTDQCIFCGALIFAWAHPSRQTWICVRCQQPVGAASGA